ncbi:MAG: hypothetical protein AAGI51_01850 [Pseudomonadota bacterium]
MTTASVLARTLALAAALAALAAAAAVPASATPGLGPSARLHGSCGAYAAMREADFPEAVTLAQGGPAPQGEAARRNAVEGLRWANRRAYSEAQARLAVLREAGRPGGAPDVETLFAWWSSFVGDIPVSQREAWAGITCPTVYRLADEACAASACDALPD